MTRREKVEAAAAWSQIRLARRRDGVGVCAMKWWKDGGRRVCWSEQGAGVRRCGQDTSSRCARRPSGVVRVRVARRRHCAKWSFILQQTKFGLETSETEEASNAAQSSFLL